MLNCAIIGLGGLGKKHLGNLLEMKDKVKVVALCDIEGNNLAATTKTNQGNIKADMDLSGCRFYTDAAEMLDKENVDLVVTALPTYLHEKYTVMALERGFHTFSEKPMARTSQQAQNMIDAAKRSGKKLMIGQCLRYKDSYLALKHYVDSGELGKPIRAAFHRYSFLPVWGWQNWYLDYEKSGCSAMDLHVHDVDLVNWIFGKPNSVSSVATHNRTKFDSITTRYFYDDVCVTADCDWSFGESFGFRRGYFAVFEKATLEMKDSGETIVCPIDGPAYPLELSGLDPYVEEMKDLINAIEEDCEITALTPESTKQTIDIVLAEIRSAETGMPVSL